MIFLIFETGFLTPGSIPDVLRNCVNKEYFVAPPLGPGMARGPLPPPSVTGYVDPVSVAAASSLPPTVNGMHERFV